MNNVLLNPFQIYNADIEIASNPGSQQISVVIDAALGNDTVFTVGWTSSSSVLATVTGPDGTFVNQSDPRYYLDSGTKLLSITLETAVVGKVFLLIHIPLTL